MNCSWLPYLTQRWCCERDHMRKGQIKNHGYSDCQTVQVLTPGTPFSTHIHFWMLLPVRKKKTAVYFSTTFSYVFLFWFFVFRFDNFQGKVFLFLYSRNVSLKCSDAQTACLIFLCEMLKLSPECSFACSVKDFCFVRVFLMLNLSLNLSESMSGAL